MGALRLIPLVVGSRRKEAIKRALVMKSVPFCTEIPHDEANPCTTMGALLQPQTKMPGDVVSTGEMGVVFTK